MYVDDQKKYLHIRKTFLAVAVLVVAAGAFGWWLGRSDDSRANNQAVVNQNNNLEPTANDNSSQDVKLLANYELPDGWKEFTCPAAAGSVLIVPGGSGGVDCGANPIAPVKISVDPGNHKDCNELQNVENVSKHICISEYINGKKSLKSETVHNKDSSYRRDTTVRAYYIDTGNGVVAVEYIYNSDNSYQTGWEQLAKSVSVKP